MNTLYWIQTKRSSFSVGTFSIMKSYTLIFSIKLRKKNQISFEKKNWKIDNNKWHRLRYLLIWFSWHIKVIRIDRPTFKALIFRNGLPLIHHLEWCTTHILHKMVYLWCTILNIVLLIQHLMLYTSTSYTPFGVPLINHAWWFNLCKKKVAWPLSDKKTVQFFYGHKCLYVSFVL